MREWCQITRTLVERHELRSVGAPFSGLAELVVAGLLGGELAKSNQRDWDVMVGDRRVQVKALWNLGKRTRRRLGTIGLDCDLVVAIVFDPGGRISEAWSVESEELDALRGGAARTVVRLPWVREHAERIDPERLRSAAGRVGLEVAA